MLYHRDYEISVDEVISDNWGSDEMVEIALPEKTFSVISLLIIFVIIFECVRLYFIGPLGFQKYFALAEGNLNQKQVELAPRGLIVDRRGKVLADNQPSYFADVDTGIIMNDPHRDEILIKVSEVLGISSEETAQFIREAISRDKRKAVVATDLDEEQIVKLRSLSEEAVSERAGFSRAYANGQMFSSVLGYTGRLDKNDLETNPGLKDYVMTGKTGIELYYDERLRGENGYSLMKSNARAEPVGEAEYY